MSSEGKKKFERLPKDVVPELYDVRLQPDLVALTFKGWEKVSVKVKTATNKIVLNAFDIQVTSASLEDKNTGRKQIPEIAQYEVEEKIEFTFQETLQVGEYFLNLKFLGNLNDQLRGFYRNKYTTADGETRYGAGTHFEATGARRAYPCWDEPALKAKFLFTLVVPKDRVALSNMPVDEETLAEDGSGLKIVKFKVTPIMSTYLTAFVVGEYDCVEDMTSNNIPVRVFVPVGKKEQGRFALEVATKALSWYEWYFDVPYGLPKLDLITLAEFPIGAMENWGLVTYRETCLLVDPETSSSSTRQTVAIIVTHELSHNWFGNLVTMDWWTDLWLKEGFATWCEYQCTDALYPDFDIWMQFIKSDQTYVFGADALSNSHPVEVEVGHPGEIDEIFDSISYCKGACLIRMLQTYIGDEAFRKGMKLYLTKHQFSNTSTSDMWAAMSEASGEDVGLIMDTWTKQMGFPLIKVEEEEDKKNNTRKVTLSQEKFCSQAPLPGQVTHVRWKVPYSITTSAQPKEPIVKGLLEGDSVTVTVPNCKPGDWIRVNPRQLMFYHVQYQPDSLSRLSSAFNTDALTPEDKMGLLIDLFAMSEANYASIVDVLKFTKGFRQEQNFAVCGKLVGALGSLSYPIQQLTQGKMAAYNSFVCQTFKAMAEQLGWEQREIDGHGQKIVREQVLTRLGLCGEPSVVAEARRRFEGQCNKTQLLSADIKTPVYVTVMAHGGRQEYDKLMKLYEQEDSLEDKNRIAKALGVVKDEDLIKATLQFSLSPKVRNQDSLNVFIGTMATLEGQQLTWEFVKDNWTELHRRYGTSTMLAKLVKLVTDGVACEKRAADMKEFFANHEADAAKRAIQQGLETIEASVAFLQKQGEDIIQFLKEEQL